VAPAELEALLSLLLTASGPPRLRRVIEFFGSVQVAWRVLRGKVNATRMASLPARLEHAQRVIADQDVQVVTMKDAGYPKRLVHLEADAPYVLFARGRLELTERIVLGVVGSRGCTEYGAESARALTMPAVRAGAVVVSGLALGIDSVAHQAALDAGGETIAVLGCGIDICYPARNRGLFERIASDGLLLSEFAPGTPALGFHFPHRNRIIALLSHALLLVEATPDSGSLITTKRAQEHMDVLVVPGPLGRRTSEGCNRAIRDGGIIVLEPEDVLRALHVHAAQARGAPEPVQLDAEARTVWRALSTEARHVDDVAERARLPVSDVALALLRMELAGQVQQMPGSRFLLCSRT